MITNTMTPGRGWAYFGLLLGLAGSTTGNVASTVLAATDVPLQLRVPFAVAWPVWTWVGIEVLTRTQWSRHWTHWIARLILMGPTTVVAAFVSYLHLSHVMLLAGEPSLARTLGPLAIDGTLFGCTVALLVTRRGTFERDTDRRTLADRVSSLRSSVLAVKDAAVSGTPDAQPTKVPEVEGPAGVPKVPAQRSPGTPTRTPALRGTWDPDKAVRMILDGSTNEDIAGTVGVGSKMIQRTRRAVLALQQVPPMDIPVEWKVPAEVQRIIREVLAERAEAGA